MGLPSGVFTSSKTGLLQVVFSGQWTVNDGDWGSGDWDILIRCVVGEGSTRKTALLSLQNPTAVLQMPYTAGDFVPVSMEYVTHSFGGAGTVAAKKLNIACHVIESPAYPRLVSFGGLLGQLREQLQPLAATVQTPRWLPDTDGSAWYVRPISELATNFKNPTPSPLGYLNDQGKGTITDVDGEQIWQDSCVAWGYKYVGDPDPIPLTCEVIGDGTQVRISGGVDPDGVVLADRWSLTYYSAPPGDGLTYATAWTGFPAIVWASIQPGDTLWVCGEHEQSQLTVQASGTAGAYVKIRLDYAPSPGRITIARTIPAGEWTAEANGEWSLYLPQVSQLMLFEDGTRLRGVSATSRARCKIVAVDTANDTIRIQSIRRIYTGMPVVFINDFTLANLPAGLEFLTQYYAHVTVDPFVFYSVSALEYTLKLCLSEADAAAGIGVDITSAGAGGNAFLFVTDPDPANPFSDPVPGALDTGQYALEPLTAKLFYKPTVGTPSDHEVRLASDKSASEGAGIYGVGVSYVRIVGGGDYGGLFGTPPLGEVLYCHTNATYFEGGSDVVIDGLLISGCRSAIVYNGVDRATARNCRLTQIGWHACGGETVETPEDGLLLERNWITGIGRGHDYGDMQAIVTNPACNNTIMRRNFVQQCGRNSAVQNAICGVIDSSEDVLQFRNWFDDCIGRGFSVGAGTDGASRRSRIVACIATRFNIGLDQSNNLLNRQCFVQLQTAGSGDLGVFDTRVYGCIVVQCSWPSTLTNNDVGGVVYMRASSNLTNPQQLTAFQRNAVLIADNGPVFSEQSYSSGRIEVSGVDYNLYAGVPRFYEKRNSATVLESYDGGHIKGLTAGFLTYDKGFDIHSELAVAEPQSLPSEPTAEQLEFLRDYDEFDTYETAIGAEVVGEFPFA